MKKKSIFLFALAVVLIFATSIGSTLAYFTSYVTSEGGKVIHLPAGDTYIEEKVSDWAKHVVITNGSDYSVYVRVKFFAGSQYSLTYDGEGWYEKDGYWYYNDIVAPGERTNEIRATITLPEQKRLPDNGDSFNVVVAYETAYVLYDLNGRPYADWTKDLIVVE